MVRPASVRWPLALATLWLLSTCVSVLAAPALLLGVEHWHAAVRAVVQWGSVQTWISIAACLGLMLLSKRKHSESVEPWGSQALLFIAGGLLTALVVQQGLLPRWVAQSTAWPAQAALLAGALLHAACAAMTWHRLRQFR